MTTTKEPTKTYRATCLSVALSPITHMMGVQGNEAVVMREPVSAQDGLRWVPVLTGNALRHRMIREPLARHLVETWGLAGKLSLSQLNFLFHGGNLTEGGGRVSIDRLNTLYRLFPMLRLLGCSLPNQIVPSLLDCHRGTLICRENENRLPSISPAGWELPRGLRPAADYVQGYQYTRNDAQTTASDLTQDSPEPAASNMMIFAGQQVIAGAAFLHGFLIRHIMLVELGAFLFALRLWKAKGGTIGGQSAKGHGRLDTSLFVEPLQDHEAAVSSYLSHLDAVREEGVAFLNGIFAPPEDKPKRGKKKPASLLPAEDESDAG